MEIIPKFKFPCKDFYDEELEFFEESNEMFKKKVDLYYKKFQFYAKNGNEEYFLIRELLNEIPNEIIVLDSDESCFQKIIRIIFFVKNRISLKRIVNEYSSFFFNFSMKNKRIYIIFLHFYINFL